MQKASFQAERAGKIIRRVREFVKKSEPQRCAVDLVEVLEDAIGFADIDATAPASASTRELEPGLPPVYADRIMIEQVLLNLIRNGLDAMADALPRRAVLTVRVRTVGADAVEVAVIDRGHGISEEGRAQLFTPFYTTKAEGMGMGLNICRSIVEFHNGSDCWSTPTPKAVPYSRLPCRRSPQLSAVPAAPDQIVHVVDDDEALRDSLAWMLEANSHAVANCTKSGEAFLAACTPEMTGCVLLDVRMPGMSGLEVFEELGRRRCAAAGGVHHRPRRRCRWRCPRSSGARWISSRNPSASARCCAWSSSACASSARPATAACRRPTPRAGSGCSPARARGARADHRRQSSTNRSPTCSASASRPSRCIARA